MTDLLAGIRTGEPLDQFTFAQPVVRATRPPTTWTLHNCRAQHTTHKALAACIWPHATWIAGSGPWAVIAHCPPVTATLHTNRAAADKALLDIDLHGCSANCTTDHRLAYLNHQPPA